MGLRRFLSCLQTWTLREVACAAGLAVVSTGAGYCLYRCLRRASAPPDHAQPPHDPVEELEVLDPPSVLQAEPNLPLLPTEPNPETPVLVLPRNAGQLNRDRYYVQFVSEDFYSSQSGSVYNKRGFIGMIRGPAVRICLLSSTESCYLDQMGFPYHTNTEDCFVAIELVRGRVTKLMICNRLEEVINGQRQNYVVICAYLLMGPDGQVASDTWIEEPSHGCSYSNPESEPDSEEHEESFTAEKEVPYISCHLAGRGVTDIGLKLYALREAFSTVLASIHNLNFLFVVGKKIVMHLAAANNQDVVGVQLAYESLIRFLRRPCNQESIEAELFGVQLHHYNFVDVFFELLLFGYFMAGSAPEPFEGGFLERLFALIGMWDVEAWEPAAAQCFIVLIDKLIELFEALFSQPMELYADPAALASTVLHLLGQHVQMMMDTL